MVGPLYNENLSLESKLVRRNNEPQDHQSNYSKGFSSFTIIRQSPILFHSTMKPDPLLSECLSHQCSWMHYHDINYRECIANHHQHNGTRGQSIISHCEYMSVHCQSTIAIWQIMHEWNKLVPNVNIEVTNLFWRPFSMFIMDPLIPNLITLNISVVFKFALSILFSTLFHLICKWIRFNLNVIDLNIIN